MVAAAKRAVEPFDLFEQGLRFLFKKDYAKAQKRFLAAKKAGSENLELQARTDQYLRVCDRKVNPPEPFVPGTPEEEFDLAVFHHNQGAYEDALKAYQKALKRGKGDLDYVYYGMAASEACRGKSKKALEHLKKAIETHERTRFFARSDPDFERLEKSDEFLKLVKSAR